MQILTIAKLARNALDGDDEDATDHAGHVFDAIIRIAAAANADLDAAQIELEDTRLRDTELSEDSTGAAPLPAPLHSH